MKVSSTLKTSNTLLLLLLLLPLSGYGHEISDSTLASRVKAAFIYKFCSYVEWPDTHTPANAGAPPFVIATFEHDSEMAHLIVDTLNERQIAGRPVEVRVLAQRQTSVPDDVDLLYLGADASFIRRQTNQLKGKPVLVITDTPGGLALGSDINFFQEDDRIRFDISLTNIQNSQLKISSRLLAVARKVEGSER